MSDKQDGAEQPREFAARDHMVEDTVALLRGSKDLDAIKTVLKALCEAFAGFVTVDLRAELADKDEGIAAAVNKAGLVKGCSADDLAGIVVFTRDQLRQTDELLKAAEAALAAAEQERDKLAASWGLLKIELHNLRASCPAKAQQAAEIVVYDSYPIGLSSDRAEYVKGVILRVFGGGQ